ncbi:MAG: rhodanese-like domain-containing protein [Deferrisomatales bacterium]|nr:rhodanese-like domain-containing protein [Deferrisomatales bacterium]
MRLLRTWSLGLAMLLVGAAGAAASYRYISPDEMNKRLEAGPAAVLVDICPAEQFQKGHLPGSIQTNAHPVKTDREKAMLEKALSAIQASAGSDVVIVCPRGGTGAERTVQHLKTLGVEENRLLILGGGIERWPHGTVTD